MSFNFRQFLNLPNFVPLLERHTSKIFPVRNKMAGFRCIILLHRSRNAFQVKVNTRRSKIGSENRDFSVDRDFFLIGTKVAIFVLGHVENRFHCGQLDGPNTGR